MEIEVEYGLYTEEGDTYLVQVLNRKGNLTEIKRLTDSNGNLTTDFDPEKIFTKQLVSDLPLKDIKPKTIYHFASPKVNYQMKASSFVTYGKPLSSACSHGLGSGIYGLYLNEPRQIDAFSSSPEQIVYGIDLRNPLVIQDSYHLNSLISASNNTSRYVTQIINAARGMEITYENILNLIRQRSLDNISLLWVIVFLRSTNIISDNKEWLRNVLANYVLDYFNDDRIKDSFTGEVIHELPINYIMRSLSYDGIIGDDKEINSWRRGCVCYNYSTATILEGSASRQCLDKR